jgi:hypothetical protein
MFYVKKKIFRVSHLLERPTMLIISQYLFLNGFVTVTNVLQKILQNLQVTFRQH